MTDPLREDVTALPCRELLSSISFRISCHPRKRTRKIEKGKKLSDTQTEEDPSNLRRKQSFGPVCRAGPKKCKKKKKERKKIKKQKRVSRNDKIRNSFRQRRQWNRNQRAL